MAKWNFTASDGTNSTVTRDTNGTLTKAEFTKSDGTATYTRAS